MQLVQIECNLKRLVQVSISQAIDGQQFSNIRIWGGIALEVAKHTTCIWSSNQRDMFTDHKPHTEWNILIHTAVSEMRSETARQFLCVHTLIHETTKVSACVWCGWIAFLAGAYTASKGMAPAILDGQKSVKAHFLWQEIFSYIKGSAEAVSAYHPEDLTPRTMRPLTIGEYGSTIGSKRATHFTEQERRW